MQGPCLQHCYSCSVATVLFANLSMCLVIASVLYLVQTRHLGTPFADSLTDAQREIKDCAAAARRRAFVIGLAIGALVLGMASPFQKSLS